MLGEMGKQEDTMRASQETTVFHGDDPDCLVAAGLACRACLSSDVGWALELDPWEERVHVRCRACRHARVLSLTPDQALRLSLHAEQAPPAEPEAPRSGRALVA
jgi:hypothetical protein